MPEANRAGDIGSFQNKRLFRVDSRDGSPPSSVDSVYPGQEITCSSILKHNDRLYRYKGGKARLSGVAS